MLKSRILWVIVLSNLVGVHWCFQKNVSPHIQRQKVSQARYQEEAGGKQRNEEAICSFETPMDYCQTAWRYCLHHIPTSHHCETSNPTWFFVIFCSYNFLPYCCALNWYEKEHCSHTTEPVGENKKKKNWK